MHIFGMNIIYFTYIPYTYICSYMYIYIYVYIIYIYIYVNVKPIFHHTPKVRNKTIYETPSFRTSGTPRNVPYTILIRNHIYIYIYVCACVYACI